MYLHVLAGLLVLAQVEDPGLKTKALAFVEAMRKGDFAAAEKELDDAMKKLSPADKMREVWELVTKNVGSLKKVLGTRTETIGKHRVVYVACEFEKAKLSVRISFDAEGRVAGYQVAPGAALEFKDPPYARRDAFTEKDVTVGEGKWALPGTLSVPAGEGPFPAVVLVHGSGPHDRDETVGPNKPLRDLAWGLAGKGIAVLRYGKRTFVHATELVKIKDEITLKEEVIDDAVAAVALLRKTDKIDPKKVYLVGHSLGGMAAPAVARRAPELAGIVAMAGNARPLEDLVVEQFTYLFSLDGEPKEKQKKFLEELKEKAAKVKDPKLGPSTPAKELPLGMPAVYWLSLRQEAPAALVGKLPQRVLVLQGERDYQVNMDDFAAWKKALADKANAKLKSYPDLNHLFMAGKGKSRPSEYDNPGHVAIGVIDDIAAWIKEK